MHNLPITDTLHHSGAFVTIHESTLTGHHHPKPIVYISIHSGYFIHHNRITQKKSYLDGFLKKPTSSIPLKLRISLSASTASPIYLHLPPKSAVAKNKASGSSPTCSPHHTINWIFLKLT